MLTKLFDLRKKYKSSSRDTANALAIEHNLGLERLRMLQSDCDNRGYVLTTSANTIKVWNPRHWKSWAHVFLDIHFIEIMKIASEKFATCFSPESIESRELTIYSSKACRDSTYTLHLVLKRSVPASWMTVEKFQTITSLNPKPRKKFPKKRNE